MKLIVADSGPLIVLARSGLLEAVRETAGEVLVPMTVFLECSRDQTKPGAQSLKRAEADQMITVVPSDDSTPTAAIANLGEGELAAIALAIARRCPALIDDRLGRIVAARKGVAVIGSAGILLAAKKRGLIAEIAPILGQWQQWGYFLSPALVSELLTRAGENPWP